jgi:ubiquinone/menaquinone biosynthesis C-methylase UbiE
MHDNPLLPLVRNPYKLLKAAGLEEGQKVIEVGCGPGFFTIPAARIVGDEGHVLCELHRVLKSGGTLSFEKTRGSEKDLIRDAGRVGFAYSEKQGRIFLFRKTKRNGG